MYTLFKLIVNRTKDNKKNLYKKYFVKINAMYYIVMFLKNCLCHCFIVHNNKTY